MDDIQHRQRRSRQNAFVRVCVRESALTLFDFVRCSVDEDVERPHHAGDGDDVEGDRTHDLPPLARRHLQLLPLRGHTGRGRLVRSENF